MLLFKYGSKIVKTKKVSKKPKKVAKAMKKAAFKKT